MHGALTFCFGVSIVRYPLKRFKPMAAKKSYPFESSLARLESLVEQMESGELSLDESLKLFEEGIKLTRECQQALSDAEQKVNLLLEKNGVAEITEFLAGDDD